MITCSSGASVGERSRFSPEGEFGPGHEEDGHLRRGEGSFSKRDVANIQSGILIAKRQWRTYAVLLQLEGEMNKVNPGAVIVAAIGFGRKSSPAANFWPLISADVCAGSI